VSLKLKSFKKLRKLRNKWQIETAEEFDKRENELFKRILQDRDPDIKGSVYITAGKVRNFALDIPKSTRPTTSRLRTTLFDILSSDIVNKSVLDLYAGTGVLGLEALSRGAKSAVFVDAAKMAEKILLKNCQKTGFLLETTVIREKVEDYLRGAIEREETYDVIFVDPPYKLYNSKERDKVEDMLNKAKQLLPGIKNPRMKKFKGVLVIKHPRRYDMDKLNLSGLKRIVKKDFGLNCLSMWIVES